MAFVEFGKRNGKDTKKIMERIRQSVQGIPGAKIAVAQENAGPPVQKDISIEITGDNLDTLVNTSDRLEEIYRQAKYCRYRRLGTGCAELTNLRSYLMLTVNVQTVKV